MPPLPPKHPDVTPATLGNPADWVDHHGDALLRFASDRVTSRELAEDLVQETFLSAFRHRSQFDGKSAFGTWLVAILRRKIVDHYRKAVRSPDFSAKSLADVEESFTPRGKWSTWPARWRSTPNQLAENTEFWTIFHDCMTGLPMHLAQVFQLRELGFFSVDETSQLIGISPENTAVRLHRARLLLRQCLENKWFHSNRGGMP